MPQPEFNPEDHERQVSENYARLARYELFNELIDYALDGVVTVDEAIKQYRHDAPLL